MIALIDEYRHELTDVACFAERTIENYVSCLVMFSGYLKKQFDLQLIEVEGKHVYQWIISLKEKGLSYSRLEHHKSALNTFYAMLVKLNIVKKNPAKGLPYFRKRGRSKVKPVDKKIVFRLLDTIDQSTWTEQRNYLILSMLWSLGLRISELTGLKVKSFEANHVQGKKIGLLRVRGKNKKQRALFVVDRLYDLLMLYLSHNKSPKKKNDPLFTVIGGTALSANRIQKKIKEYCRDAEINQRITPHVLRHSFATEMYHAGVPVAAIQSMMGHSKPAETSVYIKVNDEFKKEALYQLIINEGELWQ